MNIETLRARLAELAEQRQAAVAGMETITDAAEAEQRSEFTDDEQTSFDAAVEQVRSIDAELDDVEKRLADLEAIAARQERADSIQRRTPPNVHRDRDPFDMSDLRGAGRDELHARVRSVLDVDDERRMSLSSREKESVEGLLRSTDNRQGIIARHILATGSESYKRGFAKLVSGDAWALTEDERRAVDEARAASLTDAAGGYAVPFTLDPTIISTDAGSVNPMRMLATVKTTLTDSWNGVSSAGVTAGWLAEEAEFGDNAPTLAQPAIPVYKAGALVPFSFEVGMDWANMESDVRAMFMTAKDDLEATAHFTGTGTAQPTGITKALDGTASEIAPATAETFAVADVFAVEEALAARYRARASWTANKAIYNDIRQFGTAAQYDLWERLGAAQPAQILGYNAYEASAMDGAINAAATEDNFVLILGDFSYYYIVDRVGMSVELVPHLTDTANNLPNGQRGLMAWWRTGGDSVNDGAFAMLSIPTTV